MRPRLLVPTGQRRAAGTHPGISIQPCLDMELGYCMLGEMHR